jgi:hypothetical protein
VGKGLERRDCVGGCTGILELYHTFIKKSFLIFELFRPLLTSKFAKSANFSTRMQYGYPKTQI